VYRLPEWSFIFVDTPKYQKGENPGNQTNQKEIIHDHFQRLLKDEM
jgi:hypothetical protein